MMNFEVAVHDGPEQTVMSTELFPTGDCNKMRVKILTGVLPLLLTLTTSIAILPFAEAATTTAATAVAEAQPLPSLAPMLEQVMPAVVNVSTRGTANVKQNPMLRDPFFRRFFNVPDQQLKRKTQSLGSGVIIDAEKGYVITNNHVIDKADEITIRLSDGRKLTAKLVGTDPASDIAILQIPNKGLHAMQRGDSDTLRVGDYVVAIGNPFGLDQTATSGIVSAKGRSGLGIEGYEDFIQTDASINPGNSGGALVNLRGELVGLNTAILAPSGGNVGIGFAIPINMINKVIAQIIESGSVKRGHLGVYIQDLTPELADALKLKITKGAVITQVIPDSAAAAAGLEQGDVVISMNGRPVASSAALRNSVGLVPVGDTVQLKILRDGVEKTLSATIKKAKVQKDKGLGFSKRLSGASFSTIEGTLPDGREGGVRVVAVKSGSTAERVGLRKDDIIVTVNRQRVANLEDMRTILKGYEHAILLNILRGNGALFLVIR